MKALALSALAASAFAAPSQKDAVDDRHAIVRRQATEACSLGFCLENGGTTGGGETEPVIVTDLAGLKAAASTSGPSVIVVSGTISGSETDRVDISSDKTVFGEAGSGQ